MLLSNDGKILVKVDNVNIDSNGHYYFPESVTTISSEAFSDCANLQTIIIPENITTIGHGAFRNCISLKTLAISKSITLINNDVFNGCENLQKLTLHQGITSIGYGAFRNCISLKSLTIPEGVIAIENDACNGCKNLKFVIIPESVAEIGVCVFSDCPKLEAIIIDSTNKLFDDIKAKVISKALADEILHIQSLQLTRLMQIAQINPLYRFFNYNARYVSKFLVEGVEKELIEKNCSQIPDEIFCYVNEYLGKDSFYHRKAKNLIKSEPWPKNKDELESYKARIVFIVNDCINKAIKWTQTSLGKAQEDASSLFKCTRYR
jgi:hypothetical protein